MDHVDIIKRIRDNGFEAYLVGGAVRDLLLGRYVSDYDIATSAKYNDLRKMFPDVKTDEIGKQFQVMVIDRTEVATYRVDQYDMNGFLTSTIPVNTIEEDLKRRDLTINSMALDPFTDRLIDPYNGKSDLDRKIIRFTGDASQRIFEDPVRMIRACRFLSTIERARFAKDTFFAIQKHSHLIEDIPVERFNLEIIKAMKNSRYAGNFFRALKQTELLSYIIPEMIATYDHPGGRWHNEDVWEHSVSTCDFVVTENPHLKLAAFLHDVGKPLAWNLNCAGTFTRHEKYGVEIAEKILKRLKFSNDQIEYMTNIIGMHMDNFDEDSDDRAVRRFIAKSVKLNIPVGDIIAHIIADHDANMKKEPHDSGIFDRLMLKVKRVTEFMNPAFSLKDLAINGNDIMEEFFLNPCPIIGKTLNHLLECVIDNPKLNNHESLIKLASIFMGAQNE